MTRHSISAQDPKDDRMTRIARLLREVDALLKEEYKDSGDPGTLDDIEEESDRIAEGVRRIVSDKLLRKKESDAKRQGPPNECACTCGGTARF